ncbi:MAG TPA: hypothetical protein VKV26_21815 [Dehalococcoidia bacterium]|nr:hypothetical protein [Dehalococcoidia bacterium]
MPALKRMVVALDGAAYRRLAETAARDVREPEQQAAYLIRRALGTDKPTDEAVRDADR